MSESERMTIKEAAKMLGVSVDTMRRWDRDGRLSPSGRTVGGWRYYLFTDIKTIIDDVAYQHQKTVLRKTAATLANDAIESLRAAYHVPLRTCGTGKNLDEDIDDGAKAGLMAKAQKLLNAVDRNDYAAAIDVLTEISASLGDIAKNGT